jgi:hypothetical protein
MADEHCQDVGRYLLPAEVERVKIIGWKGNIKEILACNIVIMLGSPPVPPEAVMERLLQTGRQEELNQDGDWGDLPWIGEFPRDGQVRVNRKGYRHPAWQHAYQSILMGRTYQMLAHLAGHDAVHIHSAERWGLPLDPGPSPLSRHDSRVLEALRTLTAESATDNTEEKKNSLVAESAVNSDGGVSAKQVAALVGRPVRTVTDALHRLQRMKLAIHLGERGGWRAAEV